MTATHRGRRAVPLSTKPRRLSHGDDAASKEVVVMTVSPRPTPDCTSIGYAHPDGWLRQQWRLDEPAPIPTAAFLLTILRRKKKRRAYGPAWPGEVGA